MISLERVRARTRGPYYGWYIVGAAAVFQALQSGMLTQGYGTYIPVLREEFGWSSAALAAAFSLQRVESGLLGPLQGWMLDRWGPRRVITSGLVIVGLGFMAFSQINSLLTFYAAFLVMAIGASLSGFISVSTTLVNWFERRRATALSLNEAGMSLGGVLVPLLAVALVTFGWRTTSFASGVIILAVGLPLSRVIRDKPEDLGLLPDGDTPAEVAEREALLAASSGGTYYRASFTAAQALRTRAFWFIGFGHATALLVVSAVMVHLVVHLNEGMGFSLGRAALIVSLMTGITMAGQITGGLLGYRFNKRLICVIAMFGHALGLLALAWGTSWMTVLLFAVLHGTAWGMRGPLMQAIRADYFGRAAFGKIVGFSSLITMIGMVSGPIIAGVVADRFGNYQIGFTILAVCAALGSLFFVFATKPPVPADDGTL